MLEDVVVRVDSDSDSVSEMEGFLKSLSAIPWNIRRETGKFDWWSYITDCDRVSEMMWIRKCTLGYEIRDLLHMSKYLIWCEENEIKCVEGRYDSSVRTRHKVDSDIE